MINIQSQVCTPIEPIITYHESKIAIDEVICHGNPGEQINLLIRSQDGSTII